MQKVVRIIDVALCNKNHCGLTFFKGSNIRKYFRDNNIEYWECYEDYELDVIFEKIKNNKQ